MVKTVLYVEDDAVNRALMREVFAQEEEFELITAFNGCDAVETAQARQIDLILMDIRLPGEDGFSVLRKLKFREETKYIPVFALSAAAMSGDAERGLDAGFKAYFTKPFNIRQLVEAVRAETDVHASS